MADERYITQAQADAAKQKPIVTRGQPTSRRASRRSSSRRCASISSGSTARRCCTRTASSVTTTLDARLQELANRALEHGLRALRQAPRLAASPTRNVVAERHTIDGFKDDRWTRPIAAGDVVPAVVVTAPKTGAGAPAHRRAITPTSTREGYAWTRRDVGRRSLQAGRPRRGRDHEARRGDRHRDGDARADAARRRRASLAIDNRTGQIKAMVGGWSFSRSKFNRAVQAYRQLGSTFKPIVYTAAIDRGFTPTSILDRRAGQLLRRATGRSTARTTTTTSSRARSRCATRSRSRATSRRSR